CPPSYVFFFQAEDGIRYFHVTGVQTCALPIFEGTFAEAVDALNGASAPILALDVPSGLDADTGRVMNVAVRADVTITFVALKQGLFLGEAPDFRGELEFSDLMVPPDVFEGAPRVLERLTSALLE